LLWPARKIAGDALFKDATVTVTPVALTAPPPNADVAVALKVTEPTSSARSVYGNAQVSPLVDPRTVAPFLITTEPCTLIVPVIVTMFPSVTMSPDAGEVIATAIGVGSEPPDWERINGLLVIAFHLTC
jgi:hypothetical protein